MPVEVHLPDLPEVPISIGAPAAPAVRPNLRWHLRLRDAVSSYLPLLLMALLALGSWWLVKNVPPPLKPRVEAPPRSDPDYTMTRFVLERFEPNGRLKVRIEGEQMRHFPDTDRIEIDQLELRAFAPDGRVTLARAKRALSNGDGSEVQLMGQARVDAVDTKGVPMIVTSEFLHVFTVTERLRTHMPVTLQRAGTEVRAGGLEYDHAVGRLDLQGPQRAVFPPGPSR